MGFCPLPSFPRKRESRTVMPYNTTVLASHRGIPAYAGMTVGGRGIPAYAGMTVGGRGIPAYAGMTVGGAGFPLTRE